MRDLANSPKKRLFIDFSNMPTQEKVDFWCSVFPHDVWFRKKYQIPFLSIQHRQTTFLSIKFEYLEDSFIKKINKSTTENENFENEESMRIVEELNSMNYDEIIKMVNP